jgi:sugar (pentulose or hexulose) kinase
MDILQAALEGVALRLSMLADLVADVEVPVYGGGGALFASVGWAQIIANAMNRRLYLLDEPEVTARGVAAIVLQRFGLAMQPEVARVIEPEAKQAKILLAARARQAEFYRKTVS